MEIGVPVSLVLLCIVAPTGQSLNPGCECLIFSSTFGKEYGRFSSPDYPNSYPDDINCLLYTFIAGSSEIVEVNIRHFDLHPESPECLNGDFLRVYLEVPSAHINEDSIATGVLCSAMPSIPRFLYSTGPFLILEFHSTRRPRQAKHVGFIGTFRFIETSAFQMSFTQDNDCSYKITEINNGGKIFSPQFPSSYPRNSQCSYTLTAKEGGQVQLHFEEFDLQPGDESCLIREDVLRIFDGPGPLHPIVTVLCNQGAIPEVISSSRHLHLEFISTSTWPGHGFAARYLFTHPPELEKENRILNGPAVSATRSSCDVKLSSTNSINGSITSPGFPGPYPPKTTCQYEFSATGRQRVQLIFTDFSLYMDPEQTKDCEGADSVIAYVILDSRMEKIDTYCGVTVPKPIMSNGPRLIIHFIGLHSSRHARGFRAKYLFTSNFGITGGEQVEDYPCAFRYRAAISPSGHFTSPNFPGLYPRDTECHYFFHGLENQRVKITFHDFDVEGVMPCDVSSASDYVEFSNYMGLDRKFMRQCGQVNTGIEVESEKKFFRVTFKSNDRLDASGFNATYKFFESSTMAPATTTSQSNLAERDTRPNVWAVLLCLVTYQLSLLR